MDSEPRRARSGAAGRAGGPMTRGRTALRFLLRSLDLRAAGFALALAAVAVGASVAATSLNLRADLGPRMERDLRAYGPNLLVTPPLDAAAQGLDAAWTQRIRDLAGAGASVSPGLFAAGSADGEPATLHGVEFPALRSQSAAWTVEGRWPEDGEAACLLGSALARDLGRAPGETLRVSAAGGDPVELLVAGVVRTGESEERQVLLPLGSLQEAAGRAGRISVITVLQEGGPAKVERLAAAISAAGALEARPLRQVSAAQGALLGKLSRMMLLVTAIVLCISGLCVMTTLTTIVVERRAEIGLMRSLGASDGEVIRMLAGEATLLGLLGGALGLAIGFLDAGWLGHQVFGTALSFRAGVIPWVLAITIGLCWLAVLLPLRRALAVEPARALGGNGK